jgi:signal transduction histidine kinase
MAIRTAQDALSQRPLRFLRSSWPWRSMAYLISGLLVPVALVALHQVLVVCGVPAVVSLVVTVLCVPVLGPLIAVVERRRLRLADREPLPDPHRTVTGSGPATRLYARLREPATWREAGFAVVGVLALTSVDLALLGLAVYLAGQASFFVAGAGPAVDVALLRGGVVAVTAVVVLPIYAYLVTGWASVRAAVTRAVLAPRDAELGERLVEVSRSRARLVDAFEVERRRIERDLHDGAQQRLVALTMTLGLARLDVPDDSPLADQLDAAHRQATEALTELRELIRGVHPEVLTGRGLPAAIDDLAGRSALPIETDVRLPRRLPAAIETTAYFVVCEALANTTRHGRATSATVRAGLAEDLLVVEVTDDGRGGADPRRGSGLHGLVDRVAVLDGRLMLSSPAGGPTVLRAEIPCAPTVHSA